MALVLTNKTAKDYIQKITTELDLLFDVDTTDYSDCVEALQQRADIILSLTTSLKNIMEAS